MGASISGPPLRVKFQWRTCQAPAINIGRRRIRSPVPINPAPDLPRSKTRPIGGARDVHHSRGKGISRAGIFSHPTRLGRHDPCLGNAFPSCFAPNGPGADRGGSFALFSEIPLRHSSCMFFSPGVVRVDFRLERKGYRPDRLTERRRPGRNDHGKELH